ncbi:MAG: CoA ester lyase [Chlamydiota bacterium]
MDQKNSATPFYARCLLFTPGNNPKHFEAAKERGADGVIIDLEDAISLSEKEKARATVVEYLRSLTEDPSFIRSVRINSLRTIEGIRDLLALVESGAFPDMIVLPKTESPEEIVILRQLLFPKQVPLIPVIETAKGLYQAPLIAQEDGVSALLFGGADFSADLGAQLTWESMQTFRAELSQAAAQAGIAAIDVPYLHLQDADDGPLICETEKVKALGFTCKTSIHPKHIAPILSVLTPQEEEIQKAKKIVDTFEKAKGNACQLDGKMIDMPVFLSAKRILQLAKKAYE